MVPGVPVQLIPSRSARTSFRR